MKLLATSNSDATGSSSGYSDNQSETSEHSVLTDSQAEQLDIAAQDVKLANVSLINAIKQAMDSDSISVASSVSPNKTKRVLPASPSSSTSGASPKETKKQHRLRRSLSLVDMAEVL